MDWADELLAQQAQWNEIVYWAQYEEPVFRFVEPSPTDVMKMLDDRLYATSWSWSQDNDLTGMWGMPQYGCNMSLTTMSPDPSAVEAVVRSLVKDLETKGVYVKLQEFRLSHHPHVIEINLTMQTSSQEGMDAVRSITYERLRI